MKDNIATIETEKMSTIDIARTIVNRIFRDYTGSIAVRLWNDELIQGQANAVTTLIIQQPSVLRRLILRRDLMELAEYYLAGSLEIKGSMENLFDLKEYITNISFSLKDKWILFRLAVLLPKPDSVVENHGKKVPRQNSRESIAYHYDVSNEFYRLWLDPEMVYSCAYFKDFNQSLADAQTDKLDYICRKLRLQPGQKLLDIGCGWGALAIWAARHYGVSVHGITLSEQQHQYANTRIRQEGLQDKVSIELKDYRDLSGEHQYDRVVSVGMFEHIGVANFPTYFGMVKYVLKPGGLFLNHGITNDTGWQKTPITKFMNRYVFPDGELARISDVQLAMEQAGFEIIDVEGLRRHYAQTLRHWVQALESQQEKIRTMVDERTYAVWRLYMAGCAYFFEEGSVNVYQVLSGVTHQPLPIPLRRDDLYKTH